MKILGIVLILLTAIGIPVILIVNSEPVETIELVAKEWSCTDSYTEIHLTPVVIGKVTRLQPIVRTVCTVYERIKE